MGNIERDTTEWSNTIAPYNEQFPKNTCDKDSLKKNLNNLTNVKEPASPNQHGEEIKYAIALWFSVYVEI